MKEIKEAIQDTDIRSIIAGKLHYTDYVPENSVEVSEVKLKNIVMRYFEGSITPEEHREQFGQGHSDYYDIYDQYIFNSGDTFLVDFSGWTEEKIKWLIDLRMMLSEESIYIEKFEKLILVLYCQKKDERLRGLAKTLCKKYDWAREYVRSRNIQDEYLLLQKENNDKYKKSRGIYEDCEKECYLDGRNISELIDVEMPSDWIMQKYGRRL